MSDLHSTARWIIGSTSAFALSVAVVSPLSNIVLNKFPDNYQWQARQAIQSGDLESARLVAKKANDRQYYDFAAHRLLATIYLKENNPSAAATLLQTSINKARAIEGRQVYSESYNLPGTLGLLVEALEVENRIAFASEMQRWRFDLESLQTSLSGSDNRHKPVPITPSILNNSVRWLPLSEFSSQSGIQLLADGTLRFDSNGAVTGKFQAPGESVSHIVLELRSPKVMGIGGILRVVCDGELLADIYVDSTDPRLVELPLGKFSSTGNPELTLEYVNDEFEPVTSTDRYIELTRMGYKLPSS